MIGYTGVGRFTVFGVADGRVTVGARRDWRAKDTNSHTFTVTGHAFPAPAASNPRPGHPHHSGPQPAPGQVGRDASNPRPGHPHHREG
jgi:hypothetical protein